jgi:hypothetical protein
MRLGPIRLHRSCVHWMSSPLLPAGVVPVSQQRMKDYVCEPSTFRLEQSERLISTTLLSGC